MELYYAGHGGVNSAQLLNHCATGMRGLLVVPYDVVSAHGYLGLSYDSQSFYLDFDCQ
jgi:hypothetical protein